MRKTRLFALSAVIALLFTGLAPTTAFAAPPVPVIIEPVVSFVSDQNLIYGVVTIWVAEDTNVTDVVSTLFEYYDGVSWHTIGTDTNGTITEKSTINPPVEGDGWSIQWDATGLSEGTYTIRVTMNNTFGETGQASINTYLDPTPPIPTIIEPALTSYEATVSGLVTIKATTADEDITSFTVEVKQVPDPYEKGVETKKQHDYGDTDGDPNDGNPYRVVRDGGNGKAEAIAAGDDVQVVPVGNPVAPGGIVVDPGPNHLLDTTQQLPGGDDYIVKGEEFGGVYCGPTAAASCLRYLAAHGYPDLVKEGGKELTQRELVEKLAGLMNTRRDHGTDDGDMVRALRKWIETHGGTQPCKELIVRYWGPIKKLKPVGEKPAFWDYKRELKNCEDVLVSTPKHWMTGNSVSNKKNADGTYNVDVMDPWEGKIINFKMREKLGSPGQYEINPFTKWEKFDSMVTISPPQEKQPGWVKIGTDTYGGDGWSVTWDTSEIPSCKYYLVRGIMKDSKGNTAKTYFIVHITKPVGGVAVPVNVPVNNPSSLVPWIILTATLTLVLLSAIIYKKRHKVENFVPKLKALKQTLKQNSPFS